MHSNSCGVRSCFCAVALLAACAAGLSAQSRSSAAPAAGPDTLASHIAAGKAAAGNTWLEMYSEMCGDAMSSEGRRGAAAPAAGDAAGAGRGRGGGRQAGPPPREEWYSPPVKMFDNLYGFSTPEILDARLGEPVHNVMAMALVTSAGIIMIDATYDYSVTGLIVDEMPKLGLDPKQIKYAVITHNHFDHFGGAKYLQDTYGTKIIMGGLDWAGVEKGAAYLPGNTARKDIVVTEGQKLTLGDTTITLYNTPGHTVGTTSAIIPVKDNGVIHYAALWGGTSISKGTPYDQLVAYNSSARKMRDLSDKAGVDTILSPHGRVIDFPRRAGARNAFPTGPNPFIEGQADVKNWWVLIDHCSQAVAIAQQAAKK
jgi:metallo-beta-lactamase class B